MEVENQRDYLLFHLEWNMLKKVIHRVVIKPLGALYTINSYNAKDLRFSKGGILSVRFKPRKLSCECCRNKLCHTYSIGQPQPSKRRPESGKCPLSQSLHVESTLHRGKNLLLFYWNSAMHNCLGKSWSVIITVSISALMKIIQVNNRFTKDLSKPRAELYKSDKICWWIWIGPNCSFLSTSIPILSFITQGIDSNEFPWMIKVAMLLIKSNFLIWHLLPWLPFLTTLLEWQSNPQ